MYYKDVGYLLKETHILDKYRRAKKTYKEEKVFCNLKSIGQSEFYQAVANGLKPEIKIELKCTDIKGVTHFKLNNVIYKILRTYELQDKVELTLTKVINDGE